MGDHKTCNTSRMLPCQLSVTYPVSQGLIGFIKVRCTRLPIDCDLDTDAGCTDSRACARRGNRRKALSRLGGDPGPPRRHSQVSLSLLS